MTVNHLKLGGWGWGCWRLWRRGPSWPPLYFLVFLEIFPSEAPLSSRTLFALCLACFTVLFKVPDPCRSVLDYDWLAQQIPSLLKHHAAGGVGACVCLRGRCVDVSECTYTHQLPSPSPWRGLSEPNSKSKRERKRKNQVC